MALYQICGFETGDSYECVSVTGTTSFSSGTTAGAWSGYSLRCNPTTTATGYATISGGFNTDGTVLTAMASSEIHCGFRFKAATLPSADYELIAFADGANTFELRMMAAGNLECYYNAVSLMAAGDTKVGDGDWHYLIWDVDSGGNTNLYVDGILEWSASTGIGGPTFDTLKLGKSADRNGETVDFYFDDVVIDTTTSVPIDFRVAWLQPNGGGTDAGGTGTYADVDERPADGDTTYINLTAGAAHSVNLTSMPASPAAIHAVKAHAIVKRSGGTDGAVLVYTYSGVTQSTPAASYTTTSTYTPIHVFLLQDPDTTADWTEGGVNALEVGFADTDTVNASRATSLGIMVGYSGSLERPYPIPDGGGTCYHQNTLVNLCGFELGSVEECLSSGGTFSIQGTTTRGAWSQYALRCNPATTATGWVSFGVLQNPNYSGSGGNHATWFYPEYPTWWTDPPTDAGYHRWYFRFAADIAAEEEIARFRTITETIKFTLGSDEKIRVYLDAVELCASSVLTAATWYRLEWKHVSGAWQFKIDGTSVASGIDTWTGGPIEMVLGKYADTNGTSVDFYYDDYACKTDGYPGEGQCIRLDVTSDEVTQNWVRSSGAGTRTSHVDDIPHNSDTDYISSPAVYAQESWFYYEAMASATSILGVKAIAVGKRDGGISDAKIALRLGIEGETCRHTAAGVTISSYAATSLLSQVNPTTGAAWTRTALGTAIVGVREASVAYDSRITSVSLMVDYTPGASDNVDGQPGAAFFQGTRSAAESDPNINGQPGILPFLAPRPLVSASSNVTAGTNGMTFGQFPQIVGTGNLMEVRPGWIPRTAGTARIDLTQVVYGQPGITRFVGAKPTLVQGPTVLGQPGSMIFQAPRPDYIAAPDVILVAPGCIWRSAARPDISASGYALGQPGNGQARGTPTVGVASSGVTARAGSAIFAGTRSVSTSGSVVTARTNGIVNGAGRPAIVYGSSAMAQPGAVFWSGTRPVIESSPAVLGQPGAMYFAGTADAIASTSVVTGCPGYVPFAGTPTVGVASSGVTARAGWAPSAGTRSLAVASSVVTARTNGIVHGAGRPTIVYGSSAMAQPGAIFATGARPAVASSPNVLGQPGSVLASGPSAAVTASSAALGQPGSIVVAGTRPTIGSSSTVTAYPAPIVFTAGRPVSASTSVVTSQPGMIRMTSGRPTVSGRAGSYPYVLIEGYYESTVEITGHIDEYPQ